MPSGDEFSVVTQCPHCYGKLDFELRQRYELVRATKQDGSRELVDLSIVCITTAEERSEPFLLHMRELADDLRAEFVVGYDTYYGHHNLARAHKYSDVTAMVKSKGYIESVLQSVMESAAGTWILRLDDDEMASPAMWEWLKSREYTKQGTQIWSFPEAALWPTTMTFITNRRLWPDYHPRLVTWRYTKWDDRVHAGAPYGLGGIAPVAILHHKYLVKSLDERKRIYEARDIEHLNDFAENHMAHSMPEIYFRDDGLSVLDIGSGRFDDAMDFIGKGQLIKLDNSA